MKYDSDALLLRVDLMGTFVFAVEGATAAVQRHLDLLGLMVVSFATALGGEIIRDYAPRVRRHSSPASFFWTLLRPVEKMILYTIRKSHRFSSYQRFETEICNTGSPGFIGLRTCVESYHL